VKKVAILLDGGFVLKRLYRLLGNRHPTANDVITFARTCADVDEEVFRIYYYDCPPFDRSLANPLAPESPVNFGQTHTAQRKRQLQQKLALMDLVAFRRGELGFEGWGLSRKAEQDLLQSPGAPHPITSSNLKVRFRQKMVDMKIGLDVAWLASNKIVDRVILVTCDSDFVPAMKFARREGTQVVLVPMGSKLVKQVLREHADYIRRIEYPLTP